MTKTTTSPLLKLIRRAVERERTRQLSDQNLLREFRERGDEAAFEALLHRHGPMILSVCRNILGREADAEDAFQATCVILARKAGTIRKSASLASWLHGVAYRTALKARVRAGTREKHESLAPGRSASDLDDISWREVRHVLHEELTALSERYRAPLVTCYLEGKTQDEAALQLGMAKSTLKERLERGRTLLRTRLVRRGLGSTALLTAAAWPDATLACVPADLLADTVQAATQLAGGQAAATILSPKIIALTGGTLKTVLVANLKLGTTVLLGTALIAAGAGMTLRPSQGDDSTSAHRLPAQRDRGDPKQQAIEPGESSTASGAVTDSGKREPSPPAAISSKDNVQKSHVPPHHIHKGRHGKDAHAGDEDPGHHLDNHHHHPQPNEP